MSLPMFTFCIPNLNKIDYLPACIESVLAQDCSNWRCVFVDGYSTDGSWEYMQQYKDDPRFIIKRGLKQGMYTDWNECLSHVQTDYFYILTSDDTCYPNLVSRVIEYLDQYPALEAVHFRYEFINEAGLTIETADEIVRRMYPTYSQFNQHLHVRPGLFEVMMHCAYKAIYCTITSLAFRQTLLEKIGGFATCYGPVADFDWTMRLGFHTDVLFIPETLSTWRMYDEQATSRSKALESLENVLEIAKKNIVTLATSPQAQQLQTPIQSKILYKSFELHYAAQLYRDAFTQLPAISRLLQAIATFPLYPVKKMLKQFSDSRLFPYLDGQEMAQLILQEYSNCPQPILLY